ncbi:hypothetical protein A7K93_08010 [Candidatus Methylacidiphilum fumarolicum]|nr:hypothetical protein A7K93_08010 [Candidatus Methylacidiphilum fumarolicum]TFE74631.1 hypothetical protein A7K72_03940 [Candidatus Methylacidiphilum fumarolicum]
MPPIIYLYDYRFFTPFPKHAIVIHSSLPDKVFCCCFLYLPEIPIPGVRDIQQQNHLVKVKMDPLTFYWMLFSAVGFFFKRLWSPVQQN